jgi:hypothetical protein
MENSEQEVTLSAQAADLSARKVDLEALARIPAITLSRLRLSNIKLGKPKSILRDNKGVVTVTWKEDGYRFVFSSDGHWLYQGEGLPLMGATTQLTDYSEWRVMLIVINHTGADAAKKAVNTWRDLIEP